MLQIFDIQKIIKVHSFAFIFFSLISISFAQKSKTTDHTIKIDTSSVYNGLKFRSIGPSLMSGRIADIVIHPNNENIWYVAVGSGGVWKTENAGTTWNSLLDNQVSYSIGCIALDPQNPEIVWVGTGENVGGRHVGYGDGVYKSEDGGIHGKIWGLKNQNTFLKLLFTQRILRSCGLLHKGRFGVVVANEECINQSMGEKHGSEH